MTFDLIILFVLAIAAGCLALYIPRIGRGHYKLALVFAGSYLFSVTVIHILPELFHQDIDPGLLGIFTLGGFFLQQGLEFFSKGVEHGHIHVHNDHPVNGSPALWILLALGIHAFLEGGLLAHPQAVEHHHDSDTLLWGILIHKAPEAFALMSVLMVLLHSRRRSLFYLFLFALASPLGLFLSEYFLANELMSSRAFTYLFAVVSGNFLHISTTIVFESSADHQFNARKMGIALLAAVLASTSELLL